MDKKFSTELALPAGSLQCALYAFKGGADAVYLGLKSFSARKSAVNFSFEDLRKLKTVCLQEKKKFYVTLNTLVKDKDFSSLLPLLKQLDYLQPNGLIIQDLGIAALIKEKFPSLSLHASTQLAVHSVLGVKQLQKMGFSRVVLARELSLEEIKTIRKACPDVELKVFIHGALCFGFSGLCMASEVLTSRSANCGECAQICRSWFTNDKTKQNYWPFSMKDLCLGSRVCALEELGIDSLKIEGRMKGPDYTYWCARYYRQLLDKNTGNEILQTTEEECKVSFSRESSVGYFDGETAAENLTCSDYPSHRGIITGRIRRVMNKKAEVEFTRPAAVRDGLMILCEGKAYGFPLTKIENGRSFISEGGIATINFPDNLPRRPGYGTPLYCISRHDQNMASLNENILLFKAPLDLDITIFEDKITVNDQAFPIQVQEARTQVNQTNTFSQIFGSSDKSYYTLGNLQVTNKSNIINPFLPLSLLKQIRREFYEKKDEGFEKNLQEELEEFSLTENQKLPSRKELGLWDTTVEIDYEKYLCLSPVSFNENEFFEALDSKVKENPSLIVGLNNVSQIPWAARHPEVRVFADFFLYTSNQRAYAQLKKELPNLIGSYELDKETPFTFTGTDFTPPLFLSRVQFAEKDFNLSQGESKHFNVKTLNNLTVVTIT